MGNGLYGCCQKKPDVNYPCTRAELVDAINLHQRILQSTVPVRQLPWKDIVSLCIFVFTTSTSCFPCLSWMDNTRCYHQCGARILESVSFRTEVDHGARDTVESNLHPQSKRGSLKRHQDNRVGFFSRGSFNGKYFSHYCVIVCLLVSVCMSVCLCFCVL